MTYQEQERINSITRANRARKEAKARFDAAATLTALAIHSAVVFWLGWMLGGL